MNACPVNEKLGGFEDNTAHSNAMYGLRIWCTHSPRESACADVSDTNPVVTAHYHGFRGWKNGRNGVIGGSLGAVVFSDLVLSDNLVAGFEVERDINAEDCAAGVDGSGIGYLDGACIIGRNPANLGDDEISSVAPHGIITPRTERYSIKNVFFAHFDWSIPDPEDPALTIPAAAVGSCSHCFSERLDATDSSARTTTFTNITYNAGGKGLPHEVLAVIRYQHPFKAIFKDTDCSMIAGNKEILGTPSHWKDAAGGGTLEPCWYTATYEHNKWPGCVHGATELVGIGTLDHLGGMYCPTPIRRVVAYNYAPGSMAWKPLYILRNDDSIFTDLGETYGTEAYFDHKNDKSLMSRFAMRSYQAPRNHWAMPVVSGHKYRLQWGDGAILDWDRMRFEINQVLWAPNEGDIELELPFRDYREGISVEDEQGTVHTSDSKDANNPNPFMCDNKFVNAIDDAFHTNHYANLNSTSAAYKEKWAELILGNSNDGGTSTCNDYCDVSLERCVGLDCNFVMNITPTGGGGPALPCRMWSDPASWEHISPFRLPEDGDKVTIPLGHCIIIDVHECAMPRLKFLEVNGLLKSLDTGSAGAPGVPRAIYANNIWVRAGELQIGTPEVRYNSRFTIKLLGGSREDNWAFSAGTAVGNKALVVTGTLSLHGPVKTVTKTRLTMPLEGYNDATVAHVAAWDGIKGAADQTDSSPCRPAEGDTLAIASSNMDTKGLEFCEVVTDTGPVVGGSIKCITRPFNGPTTADSFSNFHYGATVSTASDNDGETWGGVDMRAEVTVLSRLIQITAETEYTGWANYTGSDTEPWGCRILVADWLDTGHDLPGAGGFAPRSGNVTFDYVEVKHCSQKGTWLPALKFEGAKGVVWGSKIQHSAFHTGDGPGVILDRSMNITLEDNAIVNFVEHGLWVKKSVDIKIDRTWIHHVIPPHYYFEDLGGPKMHRYQGWTGCFTLSEENNRRLVVTNNVASGCWHHGFHFLPRDCTDTQAPANLAGDQGTWFAGNVAHSISGYGAIAANVVHSGGTCVWDFSAYKVTQSSIGLGGGSHTNQAEDIVSIDVGHGIGVHGGNCGHVVIKDSKIYGDFPANQDCHGIGGNDPACDHCIDRFGLTMASIYSTEHRDREEEKWEWLPLYNYSDCFAGTVKYDGLRFFEYPSATTSCGSRQAALTVWHRQPNYVPFIHLASPDWTNVGQEAVAWLPEPLGDWADRSECGDWPCTAMKNVVIHVTGSQGDPGSGTVWSGLQANG